MSIRLSFHTFFGSCNPSIHSSMKKIIHFICLPSPKFCVRSVHVYGPLFMRFFFNIATSGMIERGKGRCIVIFTYNDSLAFS